MSTAVPVVLPQVDRLERRAAAVGGLGLLLCLVGAVISPSQFFRSYLFAFLFWVGITIGCMSILMIQHLTGGMWGLAIRRILEAGTRTVHLAALLFLPVALGLPQLYVWARPEAMSADPVLAQKALYLDRSFFLVRALFYFVAWASLAYFLNRWSLQLDRGEDLRLSRRLRGLSGGGLVLLGLTITFSSVDWAMSLDPHWFSTIYGILFMVGQALSALALAIVLVAVLGRSRPLSDVVRPAILHDLGKLLLAFVMLWAYVNFSQFLIIWSGNLPEEITWYLHRLQGGWQWLALLIVVFHFGLPFLILLSRDLKRNARLLGVVAAAVFLVRLLDLFWLVAPDLKDHRFALHWLDLAAPLGVGGIWLAAFARQLKGRPLLPVGEPEIRDLLREAGGR